MSPEQISKVNVATEDRSWQEFREQCHRQMARPLAERIRYGFCRIYKPVLDDAPWRSFNSMSDYREWCDANLPAYLGYKLARKNQNDFRSNH